MFEYVVCEVSSHFDTVRDESMYKVVRPIQGFNTEEEADYWYDLIYPFYESIQVVKLANLNNCFRHGKE